MKRKREIPQLDNRAWTLATQLDNPQAYEDYLALFRGTRVRPLHLVEANKRKNIQPIASQEKAPVSAPDPDLLLWNEVEKIHTLESYEKYIKEGTNPLLLDSAMQLIRILTPIEIEYKRDTFEFFKYRVIVKNAYFAFIDSIAPDIGVEDIKWTHDLLMHERNFDSLHSILEFVVQDRESHTFYLLDSLGKRDTFTVDVNILPIKSVVERQIDELIFTITGGIPPYYVQFERTGEADNYWLSDLYFLGDSGQEQ